MGPDIFEAIGFGSLFRFPKQVFSKASEVFIYINFSGSFYKKFFQIGFAEKFSIKIQTIADVSAQKSYDIWRRRCYLSFFTFIVISVRSLRSRNTVGRRNLIFG